MNLPLLKEDIYTYLQQWFETGYKSSHFVSSLILVAIILGIRAFISHRIRSIESLKPELKRRWIVQVRNLGLLLILMGLVVIWGEQLRSIAISVFALAAAIVIATKELIMCVSGSIHKGMSKTFAVGDRIEVMGLRGDVIDHNMFSTRLLEIGPGTLTHQYSGRTLVLPNSIFLSENVINETFANEYVLHAFVVPLSQSDDWKAVEKKLLESANEECQPYFKEAKRHIEHMAHSQGLASPSIEPRVSIQIPEPGKLYLVVRIPVPARRKGPVEQAILRKSIELMKNKPIETTLDSI